MNRRDRPDPLVATLARIIVSIERRRRLTVIEGGKSMREDPAPRKAG